MTGTLGVVAAAEGVETATVLGQDTLDTSLFCGILIGGVAAFMFNRYYRIQLPQYLGFFAGKRFVPFVPAFAAIVVGIILAFVFGGAGMKARVRGERSRAPAWVAMAISVFWNLLMCVLVLRIFLGVGRAERTVREISFLAATLSWFVAPAVGYYFARPSSQD
jgi:cellobiose-specific phosphotransferase system component IIC